MTPADAGAEACGCADYALSRRSLLRSAGLVGLAGVTTTVVGDALSSVAYGAGDGNVLVVLSLRGGADGLSMVVPHAERAYREARPTSALRAAELLQADTTFGLHPAMRPLLPLWRDRRLAAVHAVGLPAPNRSHFGAMEELEDADPGSAARVGWINRMIAGLVGLGSGLDAVQLGRATPSTAVTGPVLTLSARDLADLDLPFPDLPAKQRAVARYVQQQYADHGGRLGAAGLSAVRLAGRSGPLANVVDAAPAHGARYATGSDAGRALAQGAALVKARLGVRALAVDSGGWDHHVSVATNMKRAVNELATNVAAFFTDLGAHAERVTLVTLSEFGRRLQENGAAGLDHGYGSCALVVGAGVRGGYHARWPGLSASRLVDGDLAVTTDYRDVVAEILRARFSTVPVRDVFPGLVQKPIGVMRG